MKQQIDIFQIDAFTDTLFGGNPAAVCPLDAWLDDDILQKIASENNLPETAYFVKLENGKYHLRWFTPELEMDLCGHATLASAFVIFNELHYRGQEIIFETRSGELKVTKSGAYMALDFPSRPPVSSKLPAIIVEGLNIQPLEVWKSRDYLLLYQSESDILNIKPNVAILNEINLDPGGIIVTAPGEQVDVDFVSRFFTPGASVFEDPVTGSAHCTLIPFWAERLDKSLLRAIQVSSRRGELLCSITDNRVEIKGKAVMYMKGCIYI